jgi:hypothetical protein
MNRLWRVSARPSICAPVPPACQQARAAVLAGVCVCVGGGNTRDTHLGAGPPSPARTSDVQACPHTEQDGPRTGQQDQNRPMTGQEARRWCRAPDLGSVARGPGAAAAAASRSAQSLLLRRVPRHENGKAAMHRPRRPKQARSRPGEPCRVPRSTKETKVCSDAANACSRRRCGAPDLGAGARPGRGGLLLLPRAFLPKRGPCHGNGKAAMHRPRRAARAKVRPGKRCRAPRSTNKRTFGSDAAHKRVFKASGRGAGPGRRCAASAQRPPQPPAPALESPCP